MKTIVCLLLGCAGYAAAETNLTLALQEARFGAAGVALGNQVYVGAGYGLDDALATVEQLDPETGGVTTLPVRVTARWFLGSAAWRDRIVLAGGIRPSDPANPGGRTDLVELLDPVGGTVSNLPPLPRPRSLPALAVVGDRLYVIGGAVSEQTRSRRVGDVSIYDFNLGAWSEGPPLPTPRECAVAVIGSRIYALGGYDGSNSLDVVEVFDTENGTWESRARLAAPQSAHRAVADGDNVYLFGDYRTLVQVAAGNPETGSWRLLDLPFQPARHSVADRVGERFVVAGGNVNSSADSALAAVQVFARAQLEGAPTRTNPPPPLNMTQPAPPRPGERAVQDMLARLADLSNVYLRGTWSMAYTARGEEHQAEVPYVLKTRRPNHVYLELGPTRVWYDGTTLTMADALAGVYLQTNAPPPLDQALSIHASYLYRMLPYGHRVVIDPAAAPAMEGEAWSYRWTPGPETTRLGRTARILTSPARTTTGRARKPGYAITVDAESGITVEAITLPGEGTRPADECRPLEQELVESFRDHLVLDEFDIETRWPDETFQARLDPAWKLNPHAAYLAQRMLRPDHPVSWLGTRLENQNRSWRLTERPAGWVPLWTVRACAEEARADYDRYVISRIPPRYVTGLEGTNLVVRRWSDGGEACRLPKPELPPAKAPGWLHLAWVEGAQPEDDRLLVKWTGHTTNLLLLLDREGAVRFQRTDEEAQLDRVSVLPAGGPRREMLALVEGQVLRLVDPVDWTVHHVMRLYNERLEITDRDGDRLPEFTFIGRDVSCYEWPEPQQALP